MEITESRACAQLKFLFYLLTKPTRRRLRAYIKVRCIIDTTHIQVHAHTSHRIFHSTCRIRPLDVMFEVVPH